MKDASGASPRRIFLTYTTDKCANFLPVKVNKADDFMMHNATIDLQLEFYILIPKATLFCTQQFLEHESKLFSCPPTSL
ncbi:hypothetical protein NEPTK9_001114 [Candidatus Neptunochlamydia vexilliferae]|uniref:Uncharacterized protein n=1 Tax=Candidatus Neptunichlamydia vexilliferae TaxID=1651774 RepID=A0ABS0AZP2_9BACT|nr:hypothetical protein [Candidatus Neptunochlamydia vexilliferae]